MSVKSAVLVFIQFTSLLFFIADRHLLAYNYLLGIQILGIVVAFWGISTIRKGRFNIQPEVKPNAQLITSGPFKYIRNPMYTGIILFFSVSVSTYFTVYRMVVLLVLITVLLLKIKSEEVFLTQKFGNAYSTYKAQTKRLVPFVY
ncbi:MAG: isoprenylcysteine carboxylmethyltransferase family protein [Flavobacteriaceae bacterium]